MTGLPARFAGRAGASASTCCAARLPTGRDPWSCPTPGRSTCRPGPRRPARSGPQPGDLPHLAACRLHLAVDCRLACARVEARARPAQMFHERARGVAAEVQLEARLSRPATEACVVLADIVMNRHLSVTIWRARGGRGEGSSFRCSAASFLTGRCPGAAGSGRDGFGNPPREDGGLCADVGDRGDFPEGRARYRADGVQPGGWPAHAVDDPAVG